MRGPRSGHRTVCLQKWEQLDCQIQAGKDIGSALTPVAARCHPGNLKAACRQTVAWRTKRQIDRAGGPAARRGEGLRRPNSGWMRRSVEDENEDQDDADRVRAESAVQKDAVNRCLPPTDISREVGSESCHTSARWSIHGNVALITNEMTGFRIVDHNPVKV
jgi:hypothetical protein